MPKDVHIRLIHVLGAEEMRLQSQTIHQLVRETANYLPSANVPSSTYLPMNFSFPHSQT
jgi:hypothetical protein